MRLYDGCVTLNEATYSLRISPSPLCQQHGASNLRFGCSKRRELTLDRLCGLGTPDGAVARNLLDIVLFWPALDAAGSPSLRDRPRISVLHAPAQLLMMLVAVVGQPTKLLRDSLPQPRDEVCDSDGQSGEQKLTTPLAFTKRGSG